MTVEQGAIYALLGASGCGKTTLLSTIVGLKSLNRGEIRIFGHRPKSKGSQIPGRGVGFQPQESALFGEFTIGEAFNFFGTIFGMSKLSIKSRMDFIVKLLDLPTSDRLIRSLSGGQQRRISFAVALLHEPKLLILDEPTVGIDPLLRECIWLHLKELAANGITIVITTHNIDEAMNSTHVGLMRGGKLLTEKSPQELIEAYGCSLEEVVLRLCLRDEAKPWTIKFKSESTCQKILHESYQTFVKNMLEACSENPLEDHSKDSNLSPIHFGKPFFGDKHSTFTEYIAPSLFIAQLLFMSVSLTGQVLIDEKHQGMFERVLVAGVSKFEVIISHLIPQYLIMLGQTFTSLFILIVWFDISVRGPMFGVILIAILQGSIGILIGFLISTICHKESTAMQLTLGMITPNFVLSGVMWPIQGMPKWMKAIAYILPGTYASESIRSMLARGWSMSHPKVIPGFMVSSAWIYFLSFIVIFINRSVT